MNSAMSALKKLISKVEFNAVQLQYASSKAKRFMIGHELLNAVAEAKDEIAYKELFVEKFPEPPPRI